LGIRTSSRTTGCRRGLFLHLLWLRVPT
jgi:hypothetical protein